MLVAELRALNAKLHAFLRAADSGHTRTGYGHLDNCYDVELNYTIHTNDTFTETTYTDEQNRTPIKCISDRNIVKAFFEATANESLILAKVQDRPNVRTVLYEPYPLEFETING
jgi:hypothetical protein